MSSVNKVIIVGNLGRDPEIRYLPSGDAVANATIATSSKYKGKDGNMVEETEWHRITFFGKLAEIVAQYLKKGRSVYVEGRIKTRKYTDKDGVEKYATDIIANEMQMLGSAPDNQRQNGGGDNYGQNNSEYQRPRQVPNRQPQQAQSYAGTSLNNKAARQEEFDEDMIPF